MEEKTFNFALISKQIFPKLFKIQHDMIHFQIFFLNAVIQWQQVPSSNTGCQKANLLPRSRKFPYLIENIVIFRYCKEYF